MMNSRKFCVTVFLILAFSSIALSNQIVTYGGSFNLPIPADTTQTKGWMADAVINVPDHFNIVDLDVKIDITHTSDFDLQISLQNPAGTTIYLSYFSQFFRGANYTQTIFDDEATLPIEQGSSPFTGSFKPKAGNLLSTFDGHDCFGPWRLRIYDMAYSDTGVLNDFELKFTVPEPASVLLLIVGTGLLRLRKKKR